jgi:hypothetical protein
VVIRWGVFFTKSRTALKTGWLITAGVIALYFGVIQPRDQARGIASQKASGLAAVSGGMGWGANLALATNLNSSAPQIRSLPSKRYCWRRFRRSGCRRARLSHDIFGRACRRRGRHVGGP